MLLLRRHGAHAAQHVLPLHCDVDEDVIWQHIRRNASACGVVRASDDDEAAVDGLFVLYENKEITIMCHAQLEMVVAMLVAYGRSCARTNAAVSAM